MSRHPLSFATLITVLLLAVSVPARAMSVPFALENFVYPYESSVPIPPCFDLRTVGPIGPNAVEEPIDTAPMVRKELVDEAPRSGQRPTVFSYVVAEGDTFWDIALEFGLKVETLLGANPDLSPSRLIVGQAIRVPSIDSALHVVAAGDTLAGLASKYKVNADDILTANPIDDPDSLAVGTELIIPGATPTIVRKVSLGPGRTVTLSGQYRRPVGGFISSYYGWRWGRFHHGIDIAAPYGRSIVASRGGKVTFSGWNGGYGNTVILSHGDGVTTLYAHASRLLVRSGDWVEAGAVIAKVGSTGNSTGYHCHFEVRVNGVSVNPLDVLP